MRTDRTEIAWRGLMAGFIGYAAVALSVSLGDVLQGRSFFYTVSLLGEWLFYGLQDPAKVTVWPGAVFAYNGLHLGTFLVFGLLVSWLAAMSEQGPIYWYASLVMYLFFFAHMFVAVLFMTEPLRATIPTWQILVSSALALVAMSLYILRVYPRLRHEMSEWVDTTDGPETTTQERHARAP